jgi:3-oxoacyl-[acyl-carrier-protein] synthase II
MPGAWIPSSISAWLPAFRPCVMPVWTKKVRRPERIGVAIGSGIGGLPLIEETKDEFIAAGVRKVSPFFVPGSIINMISGNLSIMYGFKGPNIAMVTACTTGTHSIGEAARIIEYGDADVMVAGGAESTVSPLGHGRLLCRPCAVHPQR